MPSPPDDPTPADDDLLATGYTAAGVPTFDHVRSRIEGRAATALGAEELDRARPEVSDLEQREADRAAAGRDRLEEIRRSVRGEG